MADISSMGSPQHYTAFGLRIRSDIELPELPITRDGGAVDAQILLGTVPSAEAASDSPLMWIRHSDFGVGYPDVARFAVKDGNRIIVDVAPHGDDAAVRLFLLGPIFALLLHQRGLLVLHASAVSIDGQVVAFAAEKGEGKSTLAAAMHARGHAMFTDDLLPIDLHSESSLLVAPAYPQLKLYPEAAAQLNDSPEMLSRVHPGFDKRAQPTARNFPTTTQPLSRIFILETGDDETIQPIGSQQRFVELIRHSYLAQLVRSTGEAAMHFSQVVNLARRVSVAKVIRRRDLRRMGDVAELIERDLAMPANA